MAPAYVQAQRNELAELASLCAAVHGADLSEAAALCRSPYPPVTTRAALARPVS